MFYSKYNEILKNIRSHENGYDRHDVVDKFFKGKFKTVIRDLTDNYILEQCIDCTYVIELQKKLWNYVKFNKIFITAVAWTGIAVTSLEK